MKRHVTKAALSRNALRKGDKRRADSLPLPIRVDCHLPHPHLFGIDRHEQQARDGALPFASDDAYIARLCRYLFRSEAKAKRSAEDTQPESHYLGVHRCIKFDLSEFHK